VHCLVGLDLVELEKHGGCSFLVTLSGCCHIDSLKLVGIVEHHLVIVWWLQLIDCEGSRACNSSGIKRLVGVRV
jgi:hypothetical protein